MVFEQFDSLKDEKFFVIVYSSRSTTDTGVQIICSQKETLKWGRRVDEPKIALKYWRLGNVLTKAAFLLLLIVGYIIRNNVCKLANKLC